MDRPEYIRHWQRYSARRWVDVARQDWPYPGPKYAIVSGGGTVYAFADARAEAYDQLAAWRVEWALS
jgi:hypothetical protein